MGSDKKKPHAAKPDERSFTYLDSKAPFTFETGATVFIVFRYRTVHRAVEAAVSSHRDMGDLAPLLEIYTRAALPIRNNESDVLFQGTDEAAVRARALEYTEGWIQSVWDVFCAFCY